MKNICFFLLPIFMLISCDNDDDPATGELQVFIKPLYNGELLKMNELKPLDDNGELSFSRFSFFIHNLMLDNELLVETDYWRIMEAQETVDGLLGQFELPAGDYTNLSFNIGLPEDLNQQNPADFDNSSALSDFAEYWEAWSSYIFTKIEGKGDFDNDGELETNIAFHIGGNSSLRTSNTAVPIQISEGNITSITLEFDMYKMLFPESGEPFDIRAVSRTHTLELLPEAQKLLDNLLGSVLIVL